MATKENKAGLVPGRELAGAIDKAVRIAAERHQVAIGDGNVFVNWDLVGRILRDLDMARPFADTVAAELTRAGFKVKAGTMTIGRQIICGFYERARLPQVRQF